MEFKVIQKLKVLMGKINVKIIKIPKNIILHIILVLNRKIF